MVGHLTFVGLLATVSVLASYEKLVILVKFAVEAKGDMRARRSLPLNMGLRESSNLAMSNGCGIAVQAQSQLGRFYGPVGVLSATGSGLNEMRGRT